MLTQHEEHAGKVSNRVYVHHLRDTQVTFVVTSHIVKLQVAGLSRRCVCDFVCEDLVTVVVYVFGFHVRQ